MMEFLLAPILGFAGALLGSWLRKQKSVPLLSYNELKDLSPEAPKVYVTKKKKRSNAEDNALRRDREESETRGNAASD